MCFTPTLTLDQGPRPFPCSALVDPVLLPMGIQSHHRPCVQRTAHSSAHLVESGPSVKSRTVVSFFTSPQTCVPTPTHYPEYEKRPEQFLESPRTSLHEIVTRPQAPSSNRIAANLDSRADCGLYPIHHYFQLQDSETVPAVGCWA